MRFARCLLPAAVLVTVLSGCSHPCVRESYKARLTDGLVLAESAASVDEERAATEASQRESGARHDGASLADASSDAGAEVDGDAASGDDADAGTGPNADGSAVVWSRVSDAAGVVELAKGRCRHEGPCLILRCQYCDRVPSFQADLPKQPGTYTLAELHATVCHEAPRGADCAAARGTLVVRAVAPPCFDGGNDDPVFGGYVPDDHCGRLDADLVVEAEPEAAPGPRASGNVTFDYENKRFEDTCTRSFGNVGLGP